MTQCRILLLLLAGSTPTEMARS